MSPRVVAAGLADAEREPDAPGRWRFASTELERVQALDTGT